ncbi:MAG: hypothetical protein H8D78_16265 [Chloroflexi bacterium]|nr:hypothetical protein [Chloroflexota bacterium]
MPPHMPPIEVPLVGRSGWIAIIALLHVPFFVNFVMGAPVLAVISTALQFFPGVWYMIKAHQGTATAAPEGSVIPNLAEAAPQRRGCFRGQLQRLGARTRPRHAGGVSAGATPLWHGRIA